LHRQRLLVIRGNAGIQAGPEHFRRPSCLAKKAIGFAFREGRFPAIFE
jgi:hypothetical protein